MRILQVKLRPLCADSLGQAMLVAATVNQYPHQPFIDTSTIILINLSQTHQPLPSSTFDRHVNHYPHQPFIDRSTIILIKETCQPLSSSTFHTHVNHYPHQPFIDTSKFSFFAAFCMEIVKLIPFFSHFNLTLFCQGKGAQCPPPANDTQYLQSYPLVR